jgi:DNA-binding IclR family transcriptional regulator
MRQSSPTKTPVRRAAGLSTARSVLRVLTLLRSRPFGVTAADVAALLGKSASTAYHVLASLEAEGYVERYVLSRPPWMTGRFRIADLAGTDLSPGGVASPARLHAALTALSEATARRTFLALPTAVGAQIVAEVGRQGLPRPACLERPAIWTTAHGVAIGKVWLASLSEEQLALHRSRRLEAFTPSTITRWEGVERQLDEIRLTGVAQDVGELDTRLANLATAIRDGKGGAVAILSVSMTCTQFARHRAEVAATLLGVAAPLHGFPRQRPRARCFVEP